MASVINIPLYFKLQSDCLNDGVLRDQIQQLSKICIGETSDNVTEVPVPSPVHRLFIFHNQKGSHVTFVMYDDGLLTVDVQHRVNNVMAYDAAYLRTLEHNLATCLGGNCKEHNGLHCVIKRGQAVWPYGVSADERLLELDHEELIFEMMSRWQNIRIFRSRFCGNVLFLDGDAMIGESDLIYTRTLCRIGQEDYRNKTVLVLGGGDGGILHELLKEQPKFVTVAEIDEEVIKACRVHLRGVCGNSLDSLQGSNYQVVIEDCINVLKENIKNNVKFDYVINDLTELPVGKSTQGFDYDMVTTAEVTKLCVQVLKPDGKLLARGNCQGALAYHKAFETDIRSLGCEFIRHEVYVPSFHEIYYLYEIALSNNKQLTSLPNGSSECKGALTNDESPVAGASERKGALTNVETTVTSATPVRSATPITSAT